MKAQIRKQHVQSPSAVGRTRFLIPWFYCFKNIKEIDSRVLSRSTLDTTNIIFNLYLLWIQIIKNWKSYDWCPHFGPCSQIWQSHCPCESWDPNLLSTYSSWNVSSVSDAFVVLYIFLPPSKMPFLPLPAL